MCVCVFLGGDSEDFMWSVYVLLGGVADDFFFFFFFSGSNGRV